jgi:hypothetical protein
MKRKVKGHTSSFLLNFEDLEQLCSTPIIEIGVTNGNFGETPLSLLLK